MPATATRKLFVERLARQAGTPRVVDGVIHDVKFLGNESDNGRRYGLACRRKALPLYEGVAVYRNHPESARKLERKLEDWVGVLENVRAEQDGNYGNLRLRRKHADYEALIEAAEHFWRNFGLSHVAFGDGVVRNGVEHVHTIEEVRSVDLVFDPATCANLFESRRNVHPSGRVDSNQLADMARRIAALERQADDARALADIAYGFDAKVEQARQKLDARGLRYRR